MRHIKPGIVISSNKEREDYENGIKDLSKLWDADAVESVRNGKGWQCQ